MSLKSLEMFLLLPGVPKKMIHKIQFFFKNLPSGNGIIIGDFERFICLDTIQANVLVIY